MDKEDKNQNIDSETSVEKTVTDLPENMYFVVDNQRTIINETGLTNVVIKKLVLK